MLKGNVKQPEQGHYKRVGRAMFCCKWPSSLFFIPSGILCIFAPGGRVYHDLPSVKSVAEKSAWRCFGQPPSMPPTNTIG
jgi:hypothetical protein